MLKKNTLGYLPRWLRNIKKILPRWQCHVKKLVGSLYECCFDTDEIMNGAREKCEISPLNLRAVHDQNAKSTRFGTDEIMNGAREKCGISPLNL